MTTPARLSDLEHHQPAGPVPVVAPLGWMLMLGGAIGLLLSSWILYGRGAEGMWAGYRDLGLATIVITCAMSLRSSLATKPAVGLSVLCGLGLVLFGVFVADSTVIRITEIAAGAVITAGALLRGSESD